MNTTSNIQKAYTKVKLGEQRNDKVVIDDVTENFIDLENLKKSKKAAGRLQDLADLENLQ
jgi:hypothetical protein